MTIQYGADYVTPREAAAIRAAHDGFETVSVDVCNMRIDFHHYKISLPQEIVHRYIDDWRTSGLWSLPGTKLEYDL